MQLPATHLGLAAALVVTLTAHAQPVPAASSPTPNERAQRDADKVFQMILQHADKPRRVPRNDLSSGAAAASTQGTPAAARPAAAVPSRAVDTRTTTSTPPAVPAEPPMPAQPDAGVAASASPSVDAATVASDAPALLSLGSAAPVVPMTTLAPVSVAVPRSLKLELVSSIEPAFPAHLVRSLGRGSVVVNFEVRPDGTVAHTEVASSSHRGLNEAAQAAVAAWRFKPISESLPGVVELKFE